MIVAGSLQDADYEQAAVLGATRCLEGENKMCFHIAHQSQLWIAMVNDGFPRTADVPPPIDEVAARRAGLEARRIDGRPCHSPPTPQMLPYGGIQQPLRGPAREQPLRCFLQRRVVGHLSESECFNQRWAVGQVRDDAPIVGLQKALQN